jgi:hypothetical protein
MWGKAHLSSSHCAPRRGSRDSRKGILMYKKLFHSCLLGSLSTTAILAEEPGPNQIVQTGGSMGIIFKTSLIILSVACLAACSSSESDSHKKAAEDLKKDTNRMLEAIKKSVSVH